MNDEGKHKENPPALMTEEDIRDAESKMVRTLRLFNDYLHKIGKDNFVKVAKLLDAQMKNPADRQQVIKRLAEQANFGIPVDEAFIRELIDFAKAIESVDTKTK